MRITSAGNVGIGTVTPNVPLQIAGGTANTAVLIDNNAWYSGLDNVGNIIRLIGVGSVSNDVYLGAIDDAGGKVIIREDGTDKVVISGGNVGVGTGVPLVPLHVWGSGDAVESFRLGAETADDYAGMSNTGLTMNRHNNSAANFTIATTNTGSYAATGGSIVFNPNNSEAMRILKSGNVGIGTTGPDVALVVSGSDRAKLSLNNTATGGIPWYLMSSDTAWSLGGGKLVFGTNSGSTGAKMVIDSNGNVGIGTTAPGYRLQVDGSGAEGTVDQTIGITTSDTVSYGGYIGQRRTSANTRLGLVVSSAGSLTLNALNYNIDFINGAITATDDTNLKMRITSAGNVGIGTASPGEALEVNGNIITTSGGSLPHIVLDSTSSGDNWTAQGAYISIGENGALGSASMHLTYTGDGFGYSGAGTVVTGIPAGGYWRYTYNSQAIYTPASVSIGSLTLGGTAISATATELNILDGVTGLTAAELTNLGGVTATATELNYVDGVTSAIQTQLGLKAPLASPTFTGTVVIPSPFTLGATSVTATGAELNILDGVTGMTAAELTNLGGVTATATELNKLDGATVTVTELNYVDGVTSAIQTQLGLKAPLASPTFTGSVTLPGTGIWNSSGNVGIGTASPRGKLEVVSGAANADADPAKELTVVGPNNAMGLESGNLQIATNNAVAQDMGGSIAFGARYSGTAQANFAVIKAGLTGTYGGYLSLGTRPDGGAMTERIRILSGGNVGIGTTGPLSKLSVGGAGVADAGVYGTGTGYGVYGAGNSYGVYGTGNSYGVYGTGTSYGIRAVGGSTGIRADGDVYDFYAGGAGTDYGTSSSIRWKRNIQPIDNALGKVINLNGVYYDWDADHGGKHDMGMIAEDVGKIIPEIVSWDPDAPGYATGMDYGHLTPILVEAIKEQQGQIDGLKLILNPEGTFSNASSTLATAAGGNPFDWLAKGLNSLGLALQDGVASLREVVVDKITSRQMCVKDSGNNDICLTGDQLKDLIQRSGSSVTINQTYQVPVIPISNGTTTETDE